MYNDIIYQLKCFITAMIRDWTINRQYGITNVNGDVLLHEAKKLERWIFVLETTCGIDQMFIQKVKEFLYNREHPYYKPCTNCTDEN